MLRAALVAECSHRLGAEIFGFYPILVYTITLAQNEWNDIDRL